MQIIEGQQLVQLKHGKININSNIVVYPSMKKSKVKTIEEFPKKNRELASAGMATGITLTEQIYIKRGEIIAIDGEKEMCIASKIKANVFWLGKHRLIPNMKYMLKIGTNKVNATILKINRVINSSNLSNKEKQYVECNEVAECIIQLDKSIAFDTVEDNQKTSRFVIVDGYEISGGGIIIEGLENIEQKENIEVKSTNITWQQTKTNYEDRCRVLKQ